MSQFPCLLHGIAEGDDNLPHRVVVGLPVLAYEKEMDAGPQGWLHRTGQDEKVSSQLLPRILNLFCE